MGGWGSYNNKYCTTKGAAAVAAGGIIPPNNLPCVNVPILYGYVEHFCVRHAYINGFRRKKEIPASIAIRDGNCTMIFLP